VIVTTHFMAEAEYCDRAAILDNGKVLAQGTPDELRARAPTRAGHTATMEDAFIAIVLDARNKDPANAEKQP
jgi:ABC-2 type transport system ATP-binding protein